MKPENMLFMRSRPLYTAQFDFHVCRSRVIPLCLLKWASPHPPAPDFTTRVSCAHRQNYLFAWLKCRIIYFLENK